MKGFRLLPAFLVGVALLSGEREARAGEYFLDGAQQRELLMQGHITGRDEAQYDIWLVPGYAPPTRHVTSGWKGAVEDLRTYKRPEHYREMKIVTRKVFRFALEEGLHDFALRGTRGAWQADLATAQKRVNKRVFGWWFAYPWACIEAGAESAGRVGFGVPGSLLLAGGDVVVTPAAYLVAPAAMATGRALGEGVAMPVAAWSWNTVIGPPLALTGQQPAPERADGFWMKRLKDPAEDDIKARLQAWQGGWQEGPDLAALREALKAATDDHDARQAALKARLSEEEKAWEEKSVALRAEYRKAAEARASAALPALRAELQQQGYSAARLQAQREVLVDTLVSQGLDKDVAEHVVDGLTP